MAISGLDNLNRSWNITSSGFDSLHVTCCMLKRSRTLNIVYDTNELFHDSLHFQEQLCFAPCKIFRSTNVEPDTNVGISSMVSKSVRKFSRRIETDIEPAKPSPSICIEAFRSTGFVSQLSA